MMTPIRIVTKSDLVKLLQIVTLQATGNEI